MKVSGSRILITGASGRLGSELVRTLTPRYTIFAPGSSEIDVRDGEQVRYAIDSISPEIVIHCAAMTNPMEAHEKIPAKSIEVNIIGSANIAMWCTRSDSSIRLVYISTDYVYPGEGESFQRHQEDGPLLPANNYGWSKLGGECAVRMVPNSLILRCAFTPRPFKHERAYDDSYKNFLYLDEAVEKIVGLALSDEVGVINVGGSKYGSIYDFAKHDNPNVQPISRLSATYPVPYNTSMSIEKMTTILADLST